jgi:hypothetical protein
MYNTAQPIFSAYNVRSRMCKQENQESVNTSIFFSPLKYIYFVSSLNYSGQIFMVLKIRQKTNRFMRRLLFFARKLSMNKIFMICYIFLLKKLKQKAKIRCKLTNKTKNTTTIRFVLSQVQSRQSSSKIFKNKTSISILI